MSWAESEPSVEQALVDALRRGDEAAFAALINAHGPAMLRLARLQVSSQAAAEDVVQETWLRLLENLDHFQQRSSLRTWVFTILVNTARSHGGRERRTLPLSALAGDDDGGRGERGLPAVVGEAPGPWARQPSSFDHPEAHLLGAELREVVRDAIGRLPAAQATVIGLRDVDGWEAAEVCQALHLSEGNQRVLLHRARARVRAVLDQYLAAGRRRQDAELAVAAR
jgi:RNA polymerase sigma-70 factor, ECF subfamily